jgi:hypothetical protein
MKCEKCNNKIGYRTENNTSYVYDYCKWYDCQYEHPLLCVECFAKCEYCTYCERHYNGSSVQDILEMIDDENTKHQDIITKLEKALLQKQTMPVR